MVEGVAARSGEEVEQAVEEHHVPALVLVESEMDEIAHEARRLREPEAVGDAQPARDGIRRAGVVRRRVAEKRDEVPGRREREPRNHRIACRVDEVVEPPLLEGRPRGQQAHGVRLSTYSRPVGGIATGASVACTRTLRLAADVSVLAAGYER